MGFKDKLGDLAKSALKNAAKIGEVSGSAFPVGSIINLSTQEGETALLFTYPNGEEYRVTHDMVKSASVLAMGVIDIEKKSNQTTLIHGTKYKVELTDGKIAVLTVGLGSTLYKIEHIIF